MISEVCVCDIKVYLSEKGISTNNDINEKETNNKEVDANYQEQRSFYPIVAIHVSKDVSNIWHVRGQMVEV